MSRYSSSWSGIEDVDHGIDKSRGRRRGSWCTIYLIRHPDETCTLYPTTKSLGGRYMYTVPCTPDAGAMKGGINIVPALGITCSRSF